MKRVLIVVLFLALGACASHQPASQSANGNPGKPPEKSNSEPPHSTTLKTGAASGTFTADGQTFTVKYAYADRLPRSNDASIKDVVVLVTDKPVPKEALAGEMQNSVLMFKGEIHGIQYRIFKQEGGFAFTIYPGSISSSVTASLKEFSVEGNAVKGRDEDSFTFFDKKYSRALSFVATLPNQTQ